MVDVALSCALVGFDGLEFLEDVWWAGGFLVGLLLQQADSGFAGPKSV